MDIIDGNTLVIDDLDALKERECAGDTALIEVRITSKIREIASCAFKDCSNLERVTLPEGLEAIQRSAFSGCRRLKCINLPSTVRYLGMEAFLGCSALEELVFPDGIFEVGANAFQGCERIKSISIPASLVRFGNSAFANCSGLQRVDVYSTIQVKNIGCGFFEGLGMFRDCQSIRDVAVHEGVTELPEEMFVGCRNIKSISLPKTLMAVDSRVFNCYDGKLIVLRENTIFLGKDAVGRGNEMALAQHPCCSGARYFTNADQQRVDGFLKEGEGRLQKESVDVDGFCRWFLSESKAQSIANDQKTMFALLAAMENHARLLNESGLVRITDAASVFLCGFIRYAAAASCRFDGEAMRQGLLKFLGEVLREKCHNDEEQGRKCAMLAAVLSVRPSWLGDLWEKAEKRGRLAPVYEVIAGGDPVAHREFEGMRKLTGCTAKFPNDELREAARQGRVSEFMLRLPMCGLKMDGRTIAKLFKLRAAKCIVEAYRNNPELEGLLPLRLVLLAACQNWPAKDCAEFVQMAESAFPGVCASALDAFGCSPLWHSLYNKNSYCRDRFGYAWEMGNPLESELLKAGCDPRQENKFGLSFQLVVERSPKKVHSVPSPAPVQDVATKCRYVGIPLSSAVIRGGCPTRYVNALDYSEGTGRIYSWRCAGDKNIVRLWIPAEVTVIENCAFKGCENLEEVVFENCGAGAPLDIGTMAFAGCPKLANVSLSERLVSIGAGAFRDCPALVDLSIPPVHGSIQIGMHAFSNCPGEEEKNALLDAT